MGQDPKRNPLRQLLDAANLANRSDRAAAPRLCELLKANDGAVRRWGVLGLLALGPQAAPATKQLRGALRDPAPDVRMTAAETLCGLGQVKEALPVLITLLSHKDYIIRHETLLALCRIGPDAKTALPQLDNARAPGALHKGIWSSDNVLDDIPLARACLGDGAEAEAKLKPTRMKYLP
jgi:HEAT repeat protein